MQICWSTVKKLLLERQDGSWEETTIWIKYGIHLSGNFFRSWDQYSRISRALDTTKNISKNIKWSYPTWVCWPVKECSRLCNYCEWNMFISSSNSMVAVGNYVYFGQNKMVTRLNVLTGETAFFTNKSDEEIDALVKMWWWCDVTNVRAFIYAFQGFPGTRNVRLYIMALWLLE